MLFLAIRPYSWDLIVRKTSRKVHDSAVVTTRAAAHADPVLLIEAVFASGREKESSLQPDTRARSLRQVQTRFRADRLAPSRFARKKKRKEKKNRAGLPLIRNGDPGETLGWTLGGGHLLASLGVRLKPISTHKERKILRTRHKIRGLKFILGSGGQPPHTYIIWSRCFVSLDSVLFETKVSVSFQKEIKRKLPLKSRIGQAHVLVVFLVDRDCCSLVLQNTKSWSFLRTRSIGCQILCLCVCVCVCV